MMKRIIIVCVVVLGLGLFGGAAFAQQGMQQQAQGEWFCPWCGQQAGQPGQGMMRGFSRKGPCMQGHGMMYGQQCPRMMQHGYGMGPGMMHRGYGACPRMGRGMMHHGWTGGGYPSAQVERMQPMSKSKVRLLLEEYAAANPNLKVGEIEEKDEIYQGRIETKDGSLVEKILVDKETGWMKRSY